MTGLGGLLAVLGVLVFAAGVWLLRAAGPAWRVARVFAAAPEMPLADAIARARGSSAPLYVRTHGRISSAEEFPDETDRPLVFRRTRLQRAEGRGGAWRTLSDQRLAVDFGIEERGTYLDVDADALGDGLVVVPREAKGLASEMPPELAALATEAIPPQTTVRVRIEQISAVEHATVAGTIVETDAGAPRLTAGLGRPLILTTVEPDAAMRLLAADKRQRVLVAGGLLVVGLGLLAVAIVVAIIGAVA